MSITTVCEAIKDLGAEISGITTAEDPPPASMDTIKLPCLCVFTGRSQDDEGALGNYATLERRTYIVVVAIAPQAQGLDGESEETARTLIPTVKAHYRNRQSLESVTNVQSVRVTGDSGTILLRQYPKHIGFEVYLEVAEYVTKSFVDYDLS